MQKEKNEGMSGQTSNKCYKAMKVRLKVPLGPLFRIRKVETKHESQG